MLYINCSGRLFISCVSVVSIALFFSLLSGCKAGPEAAGAELADSVAYYTQLAKDMPAEPVVFYNRGIYLFRLGKYSEALSDFSNAIRINPGFYAAYLPRADCHRVMGNDAEAVANYDTFLVNTGGNAYLYRMRAWCHFRLKQYPAAVSDYSKLILLGDTNAMTYGQRGRSRFYNQEYAAATTDLQKAIQMAPDSGMLYLWLGNAQYKEGLWNESIASYLTAIEKKANLNEENFVAQAYFERAKLLWPDDLAQALKDINESLARDSANAEAYFTRGMIIYDLGEAQLGCADLRKAGMMGYVDAFEIMKTCCPPVK
ncbi:MAG: Tetratricopeptide TPR2 repeat-containing protein [Bacteroidetes bacterium]|nr:MAG: Tetratricopeptide TPR2 repeat-containing protein [Bacteroidota bacterium]